MGDRAAPRATVAMCVPPFGHPVRFVCNAEPGGSHEREMAMAEAGLDFGRKLESRGHVEWQASLDQGRIR